jgi:hypothetical protein
LPEWPPPDLPERSPSDLPELEEELPWPEDLRSSSPPDLPELPDPGLLPEDLRSSSPLDLPPFPDELFPDELPLLPDDLRSPSLSRFDVPAGPDAWPWPPDEPTDELGVVLVGPVAALFEPLPVVVVGDATIGDEGGGDEAAVVAVVAGVAVVAAAADAVPVGPSMTEAPVFPPSEVANV